MPVQPRFGAALDPRWRCVILEYAEWITLNSGALAISLFVLECHAEHCFHGFVSQSP